MPINPEHIAHYRQTVERNKGNLNPNVGFSFRIDDGESQTVSTFAGGGIGRGPGSDLMARAELNPQYEADKAATDVAEKGRRQMEAVRRREAKMGIDASSGRRGASDRNAAIALAAAKAGAANKARRNALLDNWRRMATAVGAMQKDRALNLRERGMMLDESFRRDRLDSRSSGTLSIKGRTGEQMAKDTGVADKLYRRRQRGEYTRGPNLNGGLMSGYGSLRSGSTGGISQQKFTGGSRAPQQQSILTKSTYGGWRR